MIYFIRNTNCGSIKVGRSNDPAARLRSLQTASPAKLEMLGVAPGGLWEERALHERFAASQLEGEWFRPSPELFLTIRDLCDRGPCVPDFLADRVRSVYLAGKIGGSAWRSEIMPGWGDARCHVEGGAVYDPDEEWPVLRGAVPVPGRPEQLIDYVGPYFMDMSGGHAGGNGPHAYGTRETDFNHCPFYQTNSFAVYRRCRDAIKAADMVFAWVDSDDAHGTLFELGLAAGMGILTVIAGPRGSAPESWLARQSANWAIEADTPGEAWAGLWGDAGSTPPILVRRDPERSFSLASNFCLACEKALAADEKPHGFCAGCYACVACGMPLGRLPRPGDQGICEACLDPCLICGRASVYCGCVSEEECEDSPYEYVKFDD